MARFAEFYLREEKKPSWIFVVDADEFITCCTKKTDKAVAGFTNYLQDPKAKILAFNWAQSALYSKNRKEITIFSETLSQTEFQVWSSMQACVTKTAYKTGYNMSPTIGSHFVNGYEDGDTGLRSMINIGFCMLHFPFRSVDQFRLKVIDGMNALQQTTYHESVGGHWWVCYDEYQQKGDRILEWYPFDHIRQCL